MRRAAVIMTAHNTAAYIGEAVASVRASMARVGPEWSVTLRIGVDACPETADALDRLGEPYHWSPAHVGTFVMRNSLLALEPADAFASFDADDVMLPDYLPRLLALVTDANIVGAARYDVGARLQQDSPPTVQSWKGVGSSCVMSAGALRTLGGYWTGHRVGLDTELMDRARKAGIVWAAVDAPLYLRRRNPESLTQAEATGRRSSARRNAVKDIKARATDASLIHVTPVTTPLLTRRPVQRVAVIVTTYQTQPEWLLECLGSIQRSARKLPSGITVDLRIGVDGCGASSAVLAAVGQPYYLSRQNVGTYVLRNSLVAVAPADAYIMFDSDDVMLPEYLPTVANTLQVHPWAGPSRYDCDGRLKGQHLKLYINGVCGLTHATWTRLGGYRSERYGSDSDLVERAKLAAPPLSPPYVIRQPLYLRRQHPASLTNTPATGFRSPAREAALRRMKEARVAGRWQNTPETVALEYISSTETEVSA